MDTTDTRSETVSTTATTTAESSSSSLSNPISTTSATEPSFTIQPSPLSEDNTVPLGVNKRTVPLPRPGELLIYDCRPAPSTNTAKSGSSSSSRSVHVNSQEPDDIRASGQKTASSPLDSRSRSGLGSVLLNRSKSCVTSSPPTPTPAIDIATFPNGADTEGDQSSTHIPASRPIRCLQWNIERNYKAKEIIDTLTELNADILCIQEIDIGCHRSGHERDHFLEICASQGLYGGFVPEFWELEHTGRKDRDQGGGVHGNAILSRWPINGFRVLDHVHHAYEWERDGLRLNEPRLGRRFTIVADIQTPSGPLLCYCAHLEVFTGIVGRISALSDILADSELYSDRYPYQILFGDLNTISHSIARLAKTISTDQYRIGSVGSHEAEWWDRNLWSWHVHDGEFNLALATGGWSWLRRLGFLGLGIGNSFLQQEGSHNDKNNAEKSLSGYWYSDKKYTNWLRMLVQAGLTKVQQARQEQLVVDTFVTVEHTQVFQTRHSGGNGSDSSFTRQATTSTTTTSTSTTAAATTATVTTTLASSALIDQQRMGNTSSSEDLQSERSFQDDGSIILVGRPRSPSIITLESSLLDKNEALSSPSWSSPTSPTSLLYHEQEIHADSEDESQDAFPPGDPTGSYGYTIQGSKKVFRLSTPSTPSPTLRLIPPTPKDRRSLAHGDEGYQIKDEERGVVLQYGDDENEPEERDSYDNDNDNDNDMIYDRYSYDQHVFTTQQTLYGTRMRSNSGASASASTSSPIEESRHYPFDQDHEYEHEALLHHDQNKQDSHNNVSTADLFKDPQPPFLLATLGHPSLATRRLWSGFTPLVLHQARNPGFYDPWSARNDLTLHNPNFFGLLKAKLDYTLLMNLKCVSRSIGNHDYTASDHKWLLVEVEFEREFKTGHDDGDNSNNDVIDVNNSNSSSISTSISTEQEIKLPSKEQRYRWWRERRHEWGQEVQPHANADHGAYRKRARDLFRRNRLMHGERDGKDCQQHSRLVGGAMFSAAVAVVVGGLMWWMPMSAQNPQPKACLPKRRLVSLQQPMASLTVEIASGPKQKRKYTKRKKATEYNNDEEAYPASGSQPTKRKCANARDKGKGKAVEDDNSTPHFDVTDATDVDTESITPIIPVKKKYSYVRKAKIKVAELPKNPSDPCSMLPTELWHQILDYLPLSVIARNSVLNSTWLCGARDYNGWKIAAEKGNLGMPKTKYKTYMALVCAHSYFVCDLCKGYSDGKELRSQIPLPVGISEEKEKKEDKNKSKKQNQKHHLYWNHYNYFYNCNTSNASSSQDSTLQAEEDNTVVITWNLCWDCRKTYYETHPDKSRKPCNREIGPYGAGQQISKCRAMDQYAIPAEKLATLRHRSVTNPYMPVAPAMQLYSEWDVQQAALKIHAGWVGVNAAVENVVGSRKAEFKARFRRKEFVLKEKKPKAPLMFKGGPRKPFKFYYRRQRHPNRRNRRNRPPPVNT
ncbi:hypothetical protein BG004_001250 [Podila humilis]|nr:hypothetical protein BG004_001250 [Podila humilis]